MNKDMPAIERPAFGSEFKLLLQPIYYRTAALIAQNLLARGYRNSFLGILWSLMHPLVQVSIYAIIMPFIFQLPVERYPLYLICTIAIWGYIAGTLTVAGNSVLNNEATIKRCIVSVTIFPFADVLKQTYNFAIAFTVMYLASMLLFHYVNPWVLLVPLYIIPLVIALVAVSTALAFITPYVRDIGELVTVGLNVAFWFTPIVYPVDRVPDAYRWLFEYNPFYVMMRPLIQLAYEHQLPDMHATLSMLGLTAFAVIASYLIYRRCRYNFVYYL